MWTLYSSDLYKYLGATLDGLIGDNGILEVKCPNSVAGIHPKEEAASKSITYFKTTNGEY